MDKRTEEDIKKEQIRMRVVPKADLQKQERGPDERRRERSRERERHYEGRSYRDGKKKRWKDKRWNYHN